MSLCAYQCQNFIEFVGLKFLRGRHFNRDGRGRNLDRDTTSAITVIVLTEFIRMIDIIVVIYFWSMIFVLDKNII